MQPRVPTQGRANFLMKRACRSTRHRTAGMHAGIADAGGCAAAPGSEVRSPSIGLTVRAGSPAGLDVEAACLPDMLSASNAPNVLHRQLLRSTAVQLLDAHGNAAGAAGVPVRFALRWPAGTAPAGRGATLPELACSMGALGVCETHTDDQGRALFGDLRVEEGTGAAGGEAALKLVLAAQARGLGPAAEVGGDPDEASPGEAWATHWHVPVVFTDSATRSAMHCGVVRCIATGVGANTGRHLDGMHACMHACRRACAWSEPPRVPRTHAPPQGCRAGGAGEPSGGGAAAQGASGGRAGDLPPGATRGWYRAPAEGKFHAGCMAPAPAAARPGRIPPPSVA